MTGESPVGSPRVLQVGVSYKQACGIRQYARVLGTDLERRGCVVESVWWERDDDGSLSRRTPDGLRRWRRELQARTGDGRVDVVVWHYSVFGYGARGVPVFARAAAHRLAQSGVPVVVVLHEFGHPWWWPGWRGAVFAVTHRVALVPVLRCVSGAVVTTQERERWIQERRWLPSVPLVTAPVCSTVERAVGLDDRTPATGPATTLGVFGYGAIRMRADMVMEALGILRSQGLAVGLTLVGAPGPADPAGRRWQQAADAAGVGAAVGFTGPLEPGDLSRALSALDIVVFPDEAGATSRKTTLAAALDHGCCVVALDGPGTWPALREEGALVVTEPRADQLAAELATLLVDSAARKRQGARATDFYARHMAPAVIVDRLWPLLFPPTTTMAGT